MQVSTGLMDKKVQQGKNKTRYQNGTPQTATQCWCPNEHGNSMSWETTINMYDTYTHYIYIQICQAVWWVRREYKASENGEQLRMWLVTGVWSEGKWVQEEGRWWPLVVRGRKAWPGVMTDIALKIIWTTFTILLKKQQQQQLKLQLYFWSKQ